MIFSEAAFPMPKDIQKPACQLVRGLDVVGGSAVRERCTSLNHGFQKDARKSERHASTLLSNQINHRPSLPCFTEIECFHSICTFTGPATHH